MAYNTPWVDDGAPEADSIYRRRSRGLAVSRHHPLGRLRRLVRWTGWVVLVILPAACLLALLVRFVLEAPAFALAGSDAVVLSGNHYVTCADVANALGAGAEPNVFRLSLGEARRQVEAIPWVQSARVLRIAPNRILVDVTERVPVAYVGLQGRLRLVDGEGFLLDRPAEASFDFPVVSGVDPDMTPADRKARLALFNQFAQELKAQAHGAGWLVSEVNLSDEADLKAVLVQGQESILVHFGNRDYGERFRTFLSLLPEVERTTPAVDSVDLRYRGQVVVSPKEPAQVTAGTKTPVP
ncbi:MAG TPA: FtsQ-type POTRA domain-containing protein [Terriglobia bacterium]|nr:FtsQ-type POTRA domain-containing protein [Terriglobia bacterium]